MPKSKQSLTRGQHETLGAKLKLIREDLLAMMDPLQKSYGVTSRAVNKLRRAKGALDELRSELDNRFFAENLEAESKETPYYAGAESKGSSNV